MQTVQSMSNLACKRSNCRVQNTACTFQKSRQHLTCRDVCSRIDARRLSRHSRRSDGRPAAALALPDALQGFVTAASQPHPGVVPGVLANTSVVVLGYSVLQRGLTPLGILNSWLLGAAAYSAFGAGGYSLLCLYFIIGTVVTKIKLEQKQREGIAEARSGKRGPGSVWGSGIAGFACAVMAIVTQQPALWQVGFVASLCSKLSDTVSSEIGKAYGKTTYLVTTFRTVPRGTEGAVSLEGTLAGLLAAAVFAGLSLALGQVDAHGALVVTVAAVIANFGESYLGAAVQGRVTWLSNDVVNMLQITLAAALAIGATAAGW